MVHLVLWTMAARTGMGGTDMKATHTEIGRFLEILESKQVELAQVLRTRDDIAIEKSADQVDEIQCASERDIAIRNVNRESSVLRDIRAALRRIHDGSFGTCIDCECAISPKRLVAVPWALRCVQCEDAVDHQYGQERAATGAVLVNVA
jgi:DnaK suppressor protein